MKLLIALTIVIFSGLSSVYAANKKCPAVLDYVSSVEPDTLGGPGGGRSKNDRANLQTSMPHGFLYQRGYDGPDFGDPTNRERDNSGDGYGPYFDEGVGGPRSLD